MAGEEVDLASVSRPVEIKKGEKAETNVAAKKPSETPTKKPVSTPDKTQKSLKNSVVEGGFNAASNSINDSYLTPYALHLNASNVEVGLLNSVMVFASMLAQIPGARLTKRFTRKTVWVFGQTVSKILWIPIILLPFLAGVSGSVLLLIISIGFVAFFASLKTPAWSSMMGDIVPRENRGSFFARRNVIIGISGIFATLAGGFILSAYGFPAIFIISILMGFLSILFFLRIHEPPLAGRVYKYRPSFNPKNIITTIKTHKDFAIFTSYITFVNFATEVAAPFIAVYMLKDLNISYTWFAVAIVVGALSRIFFQKYWGSLNDKYGSRKVLIIAGIFISFIPLFYMLSTDLSHIMITKLFDGFAWAGFDLIVFNYLLGVTPSDRRPDFVANYNVTASLGSILGALAGGLLAMYFEGQMFLMFQGLQVVFLFSFVLRVSTFVFLPKIKEVERKEEVTIKHVLWQAVAVEPKKGISHAVNNAMRAPDKIKGGLEKMNKSVSRGLSNMIPLDIQDYLEVPNHRRAGNDVVISIEKLETFRDFKKIISKVKKGNVVFVDLRDYREKNVVEFKEALEKIKFACRGFNCDLLFADEWSLLISQPMGKIET